MSEDNPVYGPAGSAAQTRTDEFRALLAALKLSQREAADALDVDVRTLRYWAAANPPAPLMAIYALLWIAAKRVAATPHWSELSPNDLVTALELARGSAQGGADPLRALLQHALEEGSSDGVLVQNPRGTI